MNPVHIAMCLDYASMRDPQLRYTTEEWSQPVMVEARKWMIDNELVTASGIPTDKLFAYVDKLRAVPMPTQRWV